MSQQPKSQFRDSMTKTIELLKISIDWLDRTLDLVNDQNTYDRLRRKVRVTLNYEEARLGQVKDSLYLRPSVYRLLRAQYEP